MLVSKLKFIAFGSVAMLAAGLAPGPQAFAGKGDDTLTYAVQLELESLDAYFNTSRPGLILSRSIWDQLLYRDPKTGAYLPALAESFTWVDAVTIDMTLRRGIAFHNGEAFDADDVVYTLNWVSDPANKVKNQRNVNWIKNVEKTGDFSVRIHLKDPFPAALEFLAGPLPIYPNEYYAKVGPDGMSRMPIGTGPYKVEKADPTTGTVVMVRNENYFPASPRGKPKIGRLVHKTITDKDTIVAELISGGIDWAWKISPDQVANIGALPHLSVIGGETMRIAYLGMDAAGRSGDGPLKDARVRQAIAHAINRQSIVDNLMSEGSRVVHAVCFPSQFGCTDDVTKYGYDPAKARALLAEAGYPKGISLTLDAYRNRDLAEAMLADLAAVGIKTSLNYTKYAATRDKVRAGKSQMYFMTWGSYSVHDVSAITSHFFKLSDDDTAKDTQVSAWLEEGDTSPTPSVRLSAYAKALKRIAEQAYWLPLWSYSYFYAFSKDLDFVPSADEIPRFYSSRWK